MVIGISWSGGLDSTALIYKALQEGHTVWAFYTEIKNNKFKVQAELKAIKNIFPIIKKAYENNFYYLGTTFSVDYNYNSEFHFPQLLAFLHGLAATSVEGIDEFWMGYIGNDDIIGCLSMVKKIWKTMNKNNYKHQKLRFPFKENFKEYIVLYIPKNVLDLVHYCELLEEDKKPCGKCKPCIRRGLLEIENQMLRDAKNSLKNLNPEWLKNLDKKFQGINMNDENIKMS